MIECTRLVLKKSGFPVFHFDSSMQEGHSFGERLANGFEALFSLGFEKVIAVGNDCPELSDTDIVKADDCLANREVVLGPSQDGGVYLIGINAYAFSREQFIQLPWQTSKLLENFNKYLFSQHYSYSLLEHKRDIDNQNDLFGLIRTIKRSKRFVRLILQIIFIPFIEKHLPINRSALQILALIRRRGPPPIIIRAF